MAFPGIAPVREFPLHACDGRFARQYQHRASMMLPDIVFGHARLYNIYCIWPCQAL